MMQQGHTLRDSHDACVARYFLEGVAVLAAHSQGKLVGANHEMEEPGDAQGSLN
jgi:hypothetical protein